MTSICIKRHIQFPKKENISKTFGFHDENAKERNRANLQISFVDINLILLAYFNNVTWKCVRHHKKERTHVISVSWNRNWPFSLQMNGPSNKMI